MGITLAAIERASSKTHQGCEELVGLLAHAKAEIDRRLGEIVTLKMRIGELEGVEHAQYCEACACRSCVEIKEAMDY